MSSRGGVRWVHAEVFHNRQRLYQALNYRSPEEFERQTGDS
jgi:hypothetical protein